MDSERWAQINALLDSALGLPADKQAAFLDDQCRHDPSLLREVRSILKAHKEAQSYLERPAEDDAASLLTRGSMQTADQLVGQEVDGYHILGILGQGGMGIVYQAKNLALDRIEALKVIAPSLVRDDQFLRRFRLEARTLAQIHQPNIVTIYTLRHSQLGHYLTMEYVEGHTFADLIVQEGALPWRRALPLIGQLLQAFDYAHKRGIIHRDIKPRNIMLTPAGEVKVMDFGLAKFYQRNDVTQTQGVSGTPLYMSPEQIKGQGKLDQRSDIFSLGMTLYELLSGRLPFDRDESLFKIQQSIVQEAFPTPCHFNQRIPTPLSKIIMKALEKDPAQRFQYAGEMWDAISAFQQTQGMSKGSTLTLDQPFNAPAGDSDTTLSLHAPSQSGVVAPAKASRTLWYSILGTLALVAAVAAFFLLRPSPGESLVVLPVLTIETTPPGAVVSLNGQRIGESPLRDYAIDAPLVDQQALITVHKAGFMRVDSVLALDQGSRTSLALLLEEAAADTLDGPRFAIVAITSEPSGAGVWINGRRVGVTPFSDPQMAPGRHQVRVQKEGFKAWNETVSLEVGVESPLRATLEPSPAIERLPPPPAKGLLTVHAMSEGVVYVDGRVADASQPLPVDPGSYTVRCGAGAQSAETTITVAASGAQEVTCHFAHLIITEVLPEDGTSLQARVLIDGVDAGTAPGSGARLTRPVGAYRVAVQAEGYEALDRAQTVTLQPAFEQQTHRLTFRMRAQAPVFEPAVALRQEAQSLKRALQNAITNGSWERLPGPIATYYRGKLNSRAFRRHDIVGAGVDFDPEGMRIDGTTASLPVTIRVDYQQKGGGRRLSTPPISSTWTWRIDQQSLTLIDVQDR